MRVLVVEDDSALRQTLQKGLEAAGYQVDAVGDGIAALIAVTQRPEGFQLVIADVMMPGMSGFELCRRLRDARADMPILLLTSRDGVDDRVAGLDAGADDYLVKPFAFAELLARVRALGRRQPVSTGVLQCGAVLIDSTDRTVRVQGATVTMSPREFTLLRLLAGNAGQVMTKTRILTEVWGSAQFVDGNVVEQYVSYLRRKLDPATARLSIETVRGSGYRLVVEQEVPQ